MANTSAEEKVGNAAHDAKVHGPPEKVAAYRGYAVYADYDANAPNSEDLIFCSTEELAQEVCKILNVDPRSHGDLAYTEGWEFCKSFQCRVVILTEEWIFDRTVLDALAEVRSCHEDNDDSEEVSPSVLTEDQVLRAWRGVMKDMKGGV